MDAVAVAWFARRSLEDFATPGIRDQRKTSIRIEIRFPRILPETRPWVHRRRFDVNRPGGSIPGTPRASAQRIVASWDPDSLFGESAAFRERVRMIRVEDDTP